MPRAYQWAWALGLFFFFVYLFPQPRPFLLLETNCSSRVLLHFFLFIVTWGRVNHWITFLDAKTTRIDDPGVGFWQVPLATPSLRIVILVSFFGNWSWSFRCLKLGERKYVILKTFGWFSFWKKKKSTFLNWRRAVWHVRGGGGRGILEPFIFGGMLVNW